ncbi:MAG TPA: hypothetical protein PKE06_26685 [Flavilitoribacter sp.]|nr:hypothetical protein [Lewinella sp.]MCB9279282.1 hypothetical protein [Lewinellaceae bacterium]HMQ64299.1 hypothetical protein [Flavilitoribacter sp.]HMQ86460.1 hypothetical protein [Flavilitoribacter sp.]
MNLSKTLLNAIAAGIALSAVSVSTSSCHLPGDTEEIHLSTCVENCQIDHSKQGHVYDNCPACGMG